MIQKSGCSDITESVEKARKSEVLGKRKGLNSSIGYQNDLPKIKKFATKTETKKHISINLMQLD